MLCMGIIFDIQRMSVHDGPGIRTTVFLKGCPLRCLWCHNPEGCSRRIQLSYKQEKCIGCGLCEEVCKNAVHQVADGKHEVAFEKCTLCGGCIAECPAGALGTMGVELSAEEVIQKIKTDEIFWGKTGGVTFSGGEVLMQPEFLLELLKVSKKRGYHTCVDTSGYAPWEKLEAIAEYTDVWLYDIKAYTKEIHRKATGVDNQIILENLIRLGQRQAEIYIRIPLIREVNAGREEVEKIADFLKEVPVKGVTLMPYHTLGRSKSEMIGEKMRKIFIPPKPEEMEAFKEMFRANGIRIV